MDVLGKRLDHDRGDAAVEKNRDPAHQEPDPHDDTEDLQDDDVRNRHERAGEVPEDRNAPQPVQLALVGDDDLDWVAAPGCRRGLGSGHVDTLVGSLR